VEVRDGLKEDLVGKDALKEDSVGKDDLLKAVVLL